MLILAGVSINAIVGENGVLSKAQYSTFLNEMAAVEEAVQIWKAGEIIDSKGETTTAIPANGLCKANELTATERLVGEIGYYRTWSIGETMPSTNILSSASDFNSAFESEMVFYPAGVQDLYYLNNEALGLKDNKVYLIDASTSMVYSMTGISLNGVRCYSSHMAKAVMGGVNTAPLFAEAEVSGTGSGEVLAGNITTQYLMDENGNYIDEEGNIVTAENKVLNPDYNPNGFQIIADTSNNNIYKLYNNGDLYAKGIKGMQINTSSSEMDKIDAYLYKEYNIPPEIGTVKKIIPGLGGAMYFIDSNDDLWAYGSNTSNKFGLTQEQQVEYTGRNPIKLYVNEKKIAKIFDLSNYVFAITTDNKIYVAGHNGQGELGLGHRNLVTAFTEITTISDPLNIYEISGGSSSGTMLWYNNAPDSIEEHTDEWCAYNQFYWTGYSPWGFAGINNGNATEYTTFQRILDGNNGIDYDHQIRYMAEYYAGPWIILLDGTLMQTGFGGAGVGSGWIGGGSNVNFFVRTEAKDKKFVKMWSSFANFVLLDDSGTLWGCSYNNLMLGDTTRNWILDPLENVPFSISELKEVLISDYTTFYLLNDGKVYATGNYANMGLGRNYSPNISGFVCLNDNNINNKGIYETSFPNLQTLYGGEIGDIKLDKTSVVNSYGGSNLFIGTDGKFYLTNSSTLMFRDDILQKSWIKIASNVIDFDPKCPAYIDNNNNLYVTGNSSDELGLNYESNQKVSNFIEVTDANIKGKAKKVMKGDGVLGVLTTDNELYVTGYYYYDSYYWYPGWSDITENKKDFNKVAEDVQDFDFGSMSRVLTKTNGKAYAWGNWRYWRQDAGGNVLCEIKSITDKIRKVKAYYRYSFVIDDNGILYAAGDNGYSYIGMPASMSDYTAFTEQFNNEKIKDIVSLTGSTYIVLTENGNVYGWGTQNKLGKGSISTETYQNIEKLSLSNVTQIEAGPDWFIAVTADGKVYGTGSNQYGILGRWIGVDRNQPNSRYKTAFEWVECPELEI